MSYGHNLESACISFLDATMSRLAADGACIWCILTLTDIPVKVVLLRVCLMRQAVLLLP